MRVLCLSLAALVAAACSSEEPWPWRAPNGNNGGTTEAPDADPVDADTSDDELLGRVCVVRDFQDPFACADIPLGRGVEVRDTLSTVTAISGNDTTFTMAISTSTATLEVGNPAVDLLHPTQSVVRNDSSTTPVDVAAFEQALWDDMLATLIETETAGALVVYVVDSEGDPIPNATVAHMTPPGGQRTYYDDGVGGWDGNETVTGPDGIALLLDSSGGIVNASAPGFEIAPIAMPSRTGPASIGVVTLSPAP